MAKLRIKPIEPLELEFIDGEKKVALFGNAAFTLYAAEFGDISEDMKETVMEKPYDFGARLLYCGLKVAHPTITLDEATSLMYMGGEDLFSELIRLLIENFMNSSNEETKKKFQKNLMKELKEIEEMFNLRL